MVQSVACWSKCVQCSMQLHTVHNPPCSLFCYTAGGDGPKRGLLEQMVAQEGLAGRVKLAGAIPHERAREFLVRTLLCTWCEAMCEVWCEVLHDGLAG
jgi:hypothetical protein